MRIGLIINKHIYGLFLAALFSCKTVSKVSTTVEVNDSVTTTKLSEKVTTTDSSYVKPATKLRIETQLDSSSQKTTIRQVVSSGLDTLKLTIENGKVTAESNCSEVVSRFKTKIAEKDSSISDLKRKLKNHTDVKEVLKERIVPPWWVKPLFIIMALIIALLIGYITFKKVWM